MFKRVAEVVGLLLEVLPFWKSCTSGRVLPVALGCELDRPRSMGALLDSVLLLKSGAVDIRMDGRLYMRMMMITAYSA